MGKKKIIIIDDEKDLLDLLEESLRSSNIEVETFLSPEKALSSYSDVSKIDCIVTDIRMPKMDGVELIKRFRAKEYVGPVFFITGYTDYSREVLNELRPQAIIFKPFDIDEVANLIISKLD